ASGIGKAVESILPRGNVMKHPALYMLAMALLASVPAAMAQPYPAKPIKIVIPFPPGNTMDIMTRLAGPKMTERMGQQIIVENRPGASGMLGLEFVARAAPDGRPSIPLAPGRNAGNAGSGVRCARRARRLHHRRGAGRQPDRPAAYEQEHRLRSAEGLRADRGLDDELSRHRRQPRDAVQVGR